MQALSAINYLLHHDLQIWVYYVSFFTNIQKFLNLFCYLILDQIIIHLVCYFFPCVCVAPIVSVAAGSLFYSTMVRQNTDVISIVLYLLRVSLCPNMLSISEKIFWASESPFISWYLGGFCYFITLCQAHFIYDAIQPHCFLFSSSLDNLSIGDSGMLISSTISVLKLIYVFGLNIPSFIKLGLPIFGA